MTPGTTPKTMDRYAAIEKNRIGYVHEKQSTKMMWVGYDKKNGEQDNRTRVGVGTQVG